MKKICGIIVIAILTLQTAPLCAADYTWDLVNALARNDTEKVDRIVAENADRMPASEKRLVYSLALTYAGKENALTVLRLLSKHNIRAVQYDLFNALNRMHANGVILFILDEGIKPNGEILLLAAEKQRWDLVKTFVEMGADVNYRYPSVKPYADGMTALIHASKANNLEMVTLLVENGARVNVTANNGGSAASAAYDNGRTDIYDYLREHGAADAVPNPAGDAAGTGQDDTGGRRGISTLIEHESTGIKNGTYRLSGSGELITLSGSANAGYLRYGNRGTGAYHIAGNIITITTEGRTFTYSIDTNSSFSGNGETWIRVGD